MIKSLLLSLIFAFASIHPARAIEDVTEQEQVEVNACYDACDESYDGSRYEKSGMPKWFYRKACLPMCIEGMRCKEVNNGLQWECKFTES
jgi:hypothetical protein